MSRKFEATQNYSAQRYALNDRSQMSLCLIVYSDKYCRRRLEITFVSDQQSVKVIDRAGHM